MSSEVGSEPGAETSDAETDGQLEVGKGILFKVLAFSIGLTLVFTLVANLLPQVEGEAPVEKEIDLSALTPESFAALGEALFAGKGTCALCHKPPPLGRAPDIQGENMVEMAEHAMADERYKGAAKNAEEFIRESLVDPSAYVVKDWGVSGSNDTISPMPKVDAAPIELAAVEIDAIIAYLQHKDGHDITVELPTEAPAAVETATASGGGAPAPAATAEEAIKKYGCQACHSMLGSTSQVGPSLEDVSSHLSAEQIRQSILDPTAVLTEGFTDMMPRDFAEKMTVKELSMIMDSLLGANGAEGGLAAEPSAESKSGEGAQ